MLTMKLKLIPLQEKLTPLQEKSILLQEKSDTLPSQKTPAPPCLLPSEVYKSYTYNEFIDFFTNKGIEAVNYLKYYVDDDSYPYSYPFNYSIGNFYPVECPKNYYDICHLKGEVTNIGVYFDIDDILKEVKGRELYPNTYNSPSMWWSLEKEIKKVNEFVKQAEDMVAFGIKQYIEDSNKLEDDRCSYTVYVSFLMMDYLVILDATGKKIPKVFIRPFIKVTKLHKIFGLN